METIIGIPGLNWQNIFSETSLSPLAVLPWGSFAFASCQAKYIE
jgi:hypothetical protein